MAVENHLTLQFVPILLNMVVLHHNDNHIHLIEELVKVQNLVLDNLLLSEEGIKTLQRTCKMALLNVNHLECGALTNIIYILLISDAIKTNLAVVGDAILFHNLVDAFQHKDGLVVVGLHRLVNHLSQLRIVTYQEPRVNRDAVTAYTRTGLEDVYTGCILQILIISYTSILS